MSFDKRDTASCLYNCLARASKDESRSEAQELRKDSELKPKRSEDRDRDLSRGDRTVGGPRVPDPELPASPGGSSPACAPSRCGPRARPNPNPWGASGETQKTGLNSQLSREKEEGASGRVPLSARRMLGDDEIQREGRGGRGERSQELH